MDNTEKPAPDVSREWGLDTSQQLEVVSATLEKATSDLRVLIKQLREQKATDTQTGDTT